MKNSAHSVPACCSWAYLPPSQFRICGIGHVMMWVMFGLFFLPALCPAASSPPHTYESALRFIVETESGDAALPQLDVALNAAEAALRKSGVPLKTWFFQDAGFAGVSLTGSPATQKPVLQVLQERRGACVVLTAVYLTLAERVGVNAIPMATPRHVFVRQQEGGQSMNVELLEHGTHRPDRYYILQEKAPEDDPRARDLLRAIGPGPLLAYLLNNRAVTLRAQGRADEAQDLYTRALKLDPDCQPCLYNDANLLAAAGKRRKALGLYDRALALHPWDADARRNRAHLLGAPEVQEPPLKTHRDSHP